MRSSLSSSVSSVCLSHRGVRLAGHSPQALSGKRKVGGGGRTHASVSGSPASSASDVYERRQRESRRVEERAKRVHTREEFDAALTLAEDRLVIVEAFSEDECDVYASGDNPDAWNVDVPRTTVNEGLNSKDAMMEPCARLHSTVSRVARECADVDFVLLDVIDGNTKALASELGIKTLPTVQFWKGGQMVHESKGAVGASHEVAQGALFYGDSMSGGAHASEFVDDVHTSADLHDFVNRCDLPGEGVRGVSLDVPCEKQLAVLDVSQMQGSGSSPCMHIFPAVVALAKNTAGAVRWARLLADESAETRDMANRLNVSSTPTFVFWVGGAEVGRITTSDRAVLMQSVLDTLQKFGVPLPQPPARKRMSTAEAKEIARRKREQEKRSAW